MSVIVESQRKLEEFLATDSLFVEYFNKFLGLPTFPKAFAFNSETGKFEEVSDRKKEIYKKIKNVLQSASSETCKQIYKSVNHHSFTLLPDYPMERPMAASPQEIETAYIVQSLNNEQGIEWIKANRLPRFLQSDVYSEYRLAKLLSQVRLGSRQRHNIFLMKVEKPETQRAAELRRRKKQEEDERRRRDDVLDPKSDLMKDLYISPGNLSKEELQEWFKQVEECALPDLKVIKGSLPDNKPLSGVLLPTVRNENSTSSFDDVIHNPCSRRISANTEEDDELPFESEEETKTPLWSISRLAFDSTSLDDCFNDLNKEVDIPVGNGMTSISEARIEEPITRNAYVLSEKAEAIDHATCPPPASASPCNSDSGHSLDISIVNGPIPGSEFDPDLESFDGEESASNLGAKLTGNVLKNALAIVTSRQPEDFNNHPVVRLLFEDLNGDKNQDELSKNSCERPSSCESDADSMFDEWESEDEFSPSTKKTKNLPLDLLRYSTNVAFKKFLNGTSGFKLYCLWLDVDRGRFILDGSDLEKKLYVNRLKERYFRSGSALELNSEIKINLGLTTAREWRLTNLISKQNEICLPLLSYWVPKFLLHQKAVKESRGSESEGRKVQWMELEKLKLIQITKERTSLGVESQPNPTEVLPLRPKTCHPRLLKSKPEVEIVPLIPEPEVIMAIKRENDKFSTSLPIGQIRFPRNREASRVVKKGEKRMNFAGQKQDKLESCIRYSSASSKASSQESEYLGGRRMEGMLQGLSTEDAAGKAFEEFVESQENSKWKNSVQFWKDLQRYHFYFYSNIWEPGLIHLAAERLYMLYVMKGCPRDIELDKNIRDEISRRIVYAYDDTFDPSEVHVIQTLYEPWLLMKQQEANSYAKIQLSAEKRRIKTKSKLVSCLQRRGYIRDSLTPEVDLMENFADPEYDPNLINCVPREFRHFTLEMLLFNRIELEHFRQFLQENFAGMDLMCWSMIEAWKRVPHVDEELRKKRANEVKVKFLNKKYFFGPNSPAGKEGQNKVMQAGGGWGRLLEEVPPTAVLVEVQKHVSARLEQKWLPLYLATPEFAQRQRPQQHMEDAVDDAVEQRRRRQEQAWKLLESKWVSSTKEVLALGRALSNPITALQFQKFVSLHGDFLENDVLFWIEVQKYKELHHLHSDEQMIQQKVSTIFSCFLESTLPPSVQIDISQEQADKILEKRRDLGPYLFRDAQLTVFRILLQHWNDFCDFRSNTADEKIIPLLERQKRRMLTQERVKKQRQEEMREKDVKRCQELGLPEDANLENFVDPFAVLNGGVSYETRKDSLNFSFQEYSKLLDKEDVLNNTDELTFGSVLSGNSDRTETKVNAEVIKSPNKEDGRNKKMGRHKVVNAR